jgi:hypothetical protein
MNTKIEPDEMDFENASAEWFAGYKAGVMESVCAFRDWINGKRLYGRMSDIEIEKIRDWVREHR